jgi:hypothetical protein
LRKSGVESIVLATKSFVNLANALMKSRKTDLHLLVVKHPIGGIQENEVRERAEEAMEQLKQVLNPSTTSLNVETNVDTKDPIQEENFITELELDSDPFKLNQFFYEKGWTDGLPIIPPTQKRVDEMLGSYLAKKDSVIGFMPTNNYPITYLKAAVNAVMAGCMPEYFPILVSAIKASLKPEFNLLGVLATTHPCATAIIVSGPIAKQLGISCKGNVFGPSSMASSTLGRALRLVYQNVGEVLPGTLDKATQGTPAKFTFCFAENEEVNPWAPYHVDRGFQSSDSTVTVYAAEAPANINDHGSRSGADLIIGIIGAITRSGINNLYLNGDIFLTLGPEHASLLARDGWDKEKIKQEIFEKARVPAQKMSYDQFVHHIGFHKEDYGFSYENNDGLPIAVIPEHIHILVTGGEGKHSAWLPSFGISFSVIEKIEEV